MTTHRLDGTLADYRITPKMVGLKTYITTVKPGGSYDPIKEGDTVHFLGDYTDWKFTNGALVRLDDGPGTASNIDLSPIVSSLRKDLANVIELINRINVNLNSLSR